MKNIDYICIYTYIKQFKIGLYYFKKIYDYNNYYIGLVESVIIIIIWKNNEIQNVIKIKNCFQI